MVIQLVSETHSTSVLERAAETARIALAGSQIPLLYDWRLRECDYGENNGMSAD